MGQVTQRRNHSASRESFPFWLAFYFYWAGLTLGLVLGWKLL